MNDTAAATAGPDYAAHLESVARAVSEAEAAFERTLTPEQQPLYDALHRAWVDETAAVHNRIIEELARHLPGVAPAIRALGYSHFANDDDRDGTCCMGGPERGATAPESAGWPGATIPREETAVTGSSDDRLSPYDEANDALIHLAHDLVGSPDYGGPLARTLAHLRHLPASRMEAIVRAAYELSGLLETSYDTHATTGGISLGMREFGGMRYVEGLRKRGCATCSATLPNWRDGVCRVCGAAAYARDAYYCSEEHRLMDVRDRP